MMKAYYRTLNLLAQSMNLMMSSLMMYVVITRPDIDASWGSLLLSFFWWLISLVVYVLNVFVDDDDDEGTRRKSVFFEIKEYVKARLTRPNLSNL